MNQLSKKDMNRIYGKDNNKSKKTKLLKNPYKRTKIRITEVQHIGHNDEYSN
jgi:hypothetical protein